MGYITARQVEGIRRVSECHPDCGLGLESECKSLQSPRCLLQFGVGNYRMYSGICAHMQSGMFADGWQPIIRVLVVGTLSYIAVVALLRYFGKRALSKMNAFDIVVTVAVGSAFASAVMSKQVTLLDGIVAFVLLLSLQRLFAALSTHLGWFGRYLKAQPLLLIYRGVILWNEAKKEQLGELEILGGLRSQGVAAIEDVLAMVLEPDGTFSVVKMSEAPGVKLPTALRDVKGVPEFSDEADPAAVRKMP
jgi:uncharacterized membrane protein YcaP (DUF421 family)